MKIWIGSLQKINYKSKLHIWSLWFTLCCGVGPNFEIILEKVPVVYIILHCWFLNLTLCEISLLSIGTNCREFSSTWWSWAFFILLYFPISEPCVIIALFLKKPNKTRSDPFSPQSRAQPRPKKVKPLFWHSRNKLERFWLRPENTWAL